MDELFEIHPVPVIYADGCARIDVVGHVVKLTFFELRNISGQQVKVPVVMVVRPLAGFDVARMRSMNGLNAINCGYAVGEVH